MSANWIKTKISSLATDMTDGPFGSDLKMVHYTDKREARIVQLSNVGEDGWIDDNIKYTTFKHAHEIERCIIEPGNIIIAKMMPAGRAIICPNHEPMFVQGSDVVQVIPNNKIDSTFFVYMTKQKDYLKQIDKNTQGSTRARTSISKLKEISFIIPSDINEQKRIASILSTCDTVIQKTQSTIEKYKAIKQGMMQDLFTRGLTKDGKLRPSFKDAPELYKESELGMIPKEWEVKELNEIYTKVTNAFVGTATPYYVNQGHFYLESNNVKNGFINFNNKIYINDYFYEKQKNNWLHTGDLVMVQSGHVGHTAVIPESLDNTAAHAVIIIANPKIDADSYFYNYYFFSENAVNMISKITKGNTIKHVLSSEMKFFKVAYPSIEEQKAIASRLSSIDTVIQKEEALLEKYKKIKNGLMNDLLVPPKGATIIDETED